MTGALEFLHISFAYESVDVVRDVSLSVEEGEIVCLLGPSGCGKTTCLRIAAGLERLDRGEVLIAGRRVAGAGVHEPPERRRVGLVLQDYALFPHLDVLGNVAFGGRGGTRAERRRSARVLLAQVSLAEFAEAWPHQLSGGQQQRVALARALAPQPAVMLMDEPFSGLDVTLRGDIRAATIALLKARSVPTLIVTHDPEEALAVADRIAIMRAGRIVQAGTAEDVYLHPADPFVMTFFGAPNRLSGRVDGGQVATPFGPLPVPDLKDGTAVDIFFRGSALRPAGDGSGVSMRVSAARLLGPVQRLVLEGEGGTEMVMERARRHAVAVGESIRLTAALDEFHVFPAGQPMVEEGAAG